MSKEKLEKLTKEEILQGIAKYRELENSNSLKQTRKSVEYDLKFEDEYFPPKYILAISLAEKYNDEKYHSFQAFNPAFTKKIYDKLGFSIIKKNKKEDNLSIFFSMNYTKNIILYGSPGVGKTHNTNKLIRLIEEGKSDKDIFEAIKLNEKSDSVDISDIKERVKFVTFHQSFGYEDFIEGFRPNEEGNIELVDGVFKEICKNADKDRDNKYYLIIDEINRGNISKIFGELITLIEEDKRDNLEVTLPYSKQPFKIPSNLYIIGTMNSTDKSIALIDIALRRRFTFLKMEPNAELITFSKAKEIFIALNEQITKDLGKDYQIGHSYFMKITDEDELKFVLKYKIIPLLEEYYYGDDRLGEIVKKIEK